MSKNKFNLKLTPVASNDLENVYRYISNELNAEGAAKNLLERIETSIMRLKNFPFSGSYVDDEFLKNKGYRKLVIDNYIVFYLVNKKQRLVVVMRILYGRQKYDVLL